MGKLKKKPLNNNKSKTANRTAKKVKKRHTWKSVRQKKSPVEPPQQPGPSSLKIKGDGGSKNALKEKPSLKSRMVERLNIARFRTLNESIDSRNTGNTPLRSQSTFEAYHAGLQSASSTWKTNPLDNIISWIKSTVPASKIIADFGCGNAMLSKSISHKTHSFDLHALDPCVVACDMKNVPLGDGSVDVVVFCLSLMGSEVGDFIKEAWRVLRVGGVLKIAEVMVRLGSGGRFVRQVESIGFKKLGKGKGVEELEGGVFGICGFRKVGRKLDRNCKVYLAGVTYKKR